MVVLLFKPLLQNADKMFYRKQKCFIAMTVFTIFILGFFYYNTVSSSNENYLFRLPYVVVHLDLKGAPPKMEYLLTFLKIVKEFGANAILMEYEDTFPYEGELVVLKGRNYYRRDQLKEFLLLARELNIEIIPLVQTFGHMEFVLKQNKYAHLRETASVKNSICPSKAKSLKLIQDMLTQIVQFHNETLPINHIHIGCDEVYQINKCKMCKNRKQSDINIYISHVKRVTEMVKKLCPNTTVLIWNDMLESTKLEDLSWIPVVDVEPVVWNYKEKVSMSHPYMYIWYKKFSNIWIASAFKGADGSTAILPNPKKRAMNTYSWLENIYKYKFANERHMHTFKGIFLTGWSRYNHYQPLCELLPSSMHSLIISLMIIRIYKQESPLYPWNAFYLEQLKPLVRDKFSCNIDHLDDTDFSGCKFHGSDLYAALKMYENVVQGLRTKVQKKVKYGYFNSPTELNEGLFSVKANKSVIPYLYEIARVMNQYYDDSIIEEYIRSKYKNMF